ncbi:P-loop containing nucleoside triphosphate hydrolase protein [Globomyces pollinis-pini]|nr:P-loop containing nucleoside triphosphate hydrolase protein [Globomyces pollinis-pini]
MATVSIEKVIPNLFSEELSIWLPFITKTNHRYALISNNSKRILVHLYFTKRLEKDCFISESVHKLCNESSQITIISKYSNTIPRIKTIQLTVTEPINPETFKILKQRLDILNLTLHGQVQATCCYFTHTFLDTPVHFFSNYMTLEDTEFTENSIGVFDFTTTITIQNTFLQKYEYPLLDASQFSSFTHHIPCFDKVLTKLCLRINLFTSILNHTKPNVLGFLLHGEYGTGKTSLVMSVAEQSGLYWKYTKSNDIIQSVEGNSESYLMKLVNDLSDIGPCILILDDIDLLFETKNNSIKSLLMHLFKKSFLNHIFIIGITSRFHLLDSDLVSNSAFSQVAYLGLPDFNGRAKLFQSLLKNLDFHAENDDFFQLLARDTQGYSPADLKNVVSHAILLQQSETLTKSDLVAAITLVQPANLSGIVSKIPAVSFNDLYGLTDIIHQVKKLIINPFCAISDYETLGVSPPKGVLIHGPSGVGKTALACAIVKESGMACIYVDSPSIRSKIVGQSEKLIARLFSQARSAAPCILLMDQFDMMVSKRDGTSQTSQGSSNRIVTSFLTEMDGIFTDSSKLGVFIVAITNRIEQVDPAIIRPGRLDIHLHIPLPNTKSRKQILVETLKHMPNMLEESMIDEIVYKTEGYCSGDLINICREAAMISIRQNLECIQANQIEIVLDSLKIH